MAGAPAPNFGPGKVSIQADSGYDLEIAFTLHAPKSGEYNPFAPVLLLLHPFANSQEYWQPQLDDADLGPFTMLTVDCPGHGGSTTRGRPWTHWDWARATLLIIDKLQIMRVVAIGVSQGGFTAYRVALLDAGRAGILQERKVFGVVSCGSSIEKEAPDFVKMYLGTKDELVAKATSDSGSSAIETFATGMAQDQIAGDEKRETSEWVAFGKKTIVTSLSKATSHGKDEVAAQLKANFTALTQREALTDRLKAEGLRCPVLVVHGTADIAYPIKDGYHQRQVDVLGAKLELIDGAPHFTNLSAHKEFDRIVLDFVNSLVS